MPRSSPPKHRHDGTSPLPMGMDWSPAPRKWEGRDTVWPHAPRTGWSYCVMIPSWVVQPESGASADSLLNPIIFYRIQVGIQSPEGLSTSRGILRRFSDFLKLLSALKKVFPRKSIPSAPPKHSLLRINSSRVLLEERRCALEEWMGKLLSDVDVSRSAPVAAFLELEAAFRSAFEDVNSQSLAPSHSGGSFSLRSNSAVSIVNSSTNVSISRSLSSEFSSDQLCETSELEAPMISRLHISDAGVEDLRLVYDSTSAAEPQANGALSGDSFLDLPEDLHRNKLQNRTENLVLGNDYAFGNSSKEASFSTIKLELTSGQANDKLPGHARRFSDESIGSDMSSIRGSELSNPGVTNSVDDGSGGLVGGAEAQSGSDAQFLNDAQMILPLDQRHKLNRILLIMQRRLATARNDMEDLIARLNQEMAVKEYLTTKVKDLEGELEATVQKSKENLQQTIVIERDRVTQMQWDMDELRRKCMEMESRLKFEQDQKDRGESEKTTASGEKELLLQELAAKQEKVDTLQKRLDELEIKSKSDIKVLVKEVKFLRSSQAELKEALNQSMKEKIELERVVQKDNQRQANTLVARKKLLHEFYVLRNRLQECSVNFLAEEEDKFSLGSSSLSDALDILTTSDNRIGLLLAEAQLLAQEDEHVIDEDKSCGDGSSKIESVNGEDPFVLDNEIKRVLTDLLIDNARLRKQVNSVMQCALKNLFMPEKEEFSGAPPRKTVLNMFLDR